MSGLVPFAFWLATALFLICAYPISPPGMVKGLSATMMANALFLISTCCLIIYVFHKGGSCRGCSMKRRRIKRSAYTLLCAIVLYGYLAVNDLVRRGREDITMLLLLVYAFVAFLLLSLFFAMRYWHNNVDQQ